MWPNENLHVYQSVPWVRRLLPDRVWVQPGLRQDHHDAGKRARPTYDYDNQDQRDDYLPDVQR